MSHVKHKVKRRVTKLIVGLLDGNTYILIPFFMCANTLLISSDACEPCAAGSKRA